MKEFNNLEEIKKYYDKKTNTYIFNEGGKYIDLVKFNFNLDVKSNINALDIKALDINAGNINARDIDAWNIKARDIDAVNIKFYSVCVSYNNIKCNSINSRRKNSFYKTLDGEVIIKGE